MRRKGLDERGFSLIELIMVMGVLSLVLVMSFVTFSNAQRKARDAARVGALSEIRKALQSYHTDHESYPSTGGQWWGRCPGLGNHDTTGANGYVPGLAPQHALKLPVDPRYDADNCYGYQYRSNGVNYKLIANQTAEVLCPTVGQAWYDPARPQTDCVLAVFTEPAALW